MSRLIRALGALAALVAMLVGVPWLLVRIAGWPLPTKVPDWSNAATMMQQGNIEATTVIKVLACVVWVAWIVIAWAVVWEALVNVPRMLRGRRHEPTPLAPAAVSKGVGWLFTVLLATTAVSQPAHAVPSLGSLAGLEPDDLADVELSVDASGITTERSAPTSASFGGYGEFERAEVWMADDSDSLWSIAQQSGVSVDEILVANAALTPTSMIEVGMRIRLPKGVLIPDARRADSQVVVTAGDPATSEAAPPMRSYVVRENDGMWNVADALLGDGSRHVEMAELAIGQEVAPGVIFTADTLTIHPGWVFSLDTAASTAAPATADTYFVVKDDSLSSIAEETLGDQDRWVDLWNLNGGRTMNDGRVFDDPDLIHPGWELEITEPITEETAEPPVREIVEDPPVEETTTPPVDDIAEPSVDEVVEPPVDQLAEPSVDEIVEVRPQIGLPPPVAPHEGPVEAPSVPSPSGTRPALDEAGLEDEISDVDWQRSVWAQIAAGSLLLAGLAVMVRRLRLRRLARLESGRRLVQPPSVAAGTELAVTRSTAPMTELSTLRGLLQSLTPYAREQADPPPVRAVQIGSERVEVVFSSPAPMPPKGWSTIDGGKSWTHRFDNEPVCSRQLLTPALVTIGIRSDEAGDEVLLDLETAASVAIAGNHDAAAGLARSMALELATYPLGVPMDLCLIGLHVDGTETCDRVWLDTTLQRAVRVTRQRLDSMGSQGSTSMVAARAELDEDDGAHDPTVFIVNVDSVSAGDRALLDELIDICQPSTGTAVVLVGEHLNANEQIRIDADSSIVWSDVALLAPNVTLEAAAEAAVMLDHAANAESEAMEPCELMVALLEMTNPDKADDVLLARDTGTLDGHVEVAHDVDDVVLEYVYTPPAHDVLLQVMGSVVAHGVDLTFDETELLGLMTCLRGRDVHIDLICEAIAPDRIRKTVENRVSKLRGRLGVGSDGVDILPAADKTGRGLNAIYSISNLVLTDVDLLEHRLHTAHTLSSTDALRVLRDGLDLMKGPLFRARKGFDGWPHSEGVVVAMTSVITNYACRLIELAVEVDDIALVVRTTAAAGSVLDNPVAEFPFRQVEEEYAECCGDEQLAASVGTARQRLLAYLQHEDSLATP